MRGLSWHQSPVQGGVILSAACASETEEQDVCCEVASPRNIREATPMKSQCWTVWTVREQLVICTLKNGVMSLWRDYLRRSFKTALGAGYGVECLKSQYLEGRGKEHQEFKVILICIVAWILIDLKNKNPDSNMGCGELNDQRSKAASR